MKKLTPWAIVAAVLLFELYAFRAMAQEPTGPSIATTRWMYSGAQAAGMIKVQIPLSSQYQTMGPDSPPPDTQTLDGGEKGGSWRITAHGAVPVDAPTEGGDTTVPNKASQALPPRFLPGVAVYKDKRFMGLIVGKTVHFSCRDALDATQSAIAKHFEAVDGSSAIGLCIPVPTYTVADLVPPELSKPEVNKPADDNTV